MEKITNYAVYNNGMRNTIIDKMWFLDYISPNISTIIDFGCADGDLFKEIEKIYPNKFDYIGIDNDKIMRTRAKANLRFAAERVDIFESLEDLKLFDLDMSKCILVMNSIIHEIYSYCSYVEIRKIFNQIKNSGIKYIAIRDMHLIQNENEGWRTLKELPKEYHQKFYETTEYVFHNDFTNQILEFLLKYSYDENWERERKERYLWNWEFELLYTLKNYNLKQSFSFSIPYLENKWKKDLGIEFHYKTHKKILLELSTF